MDEGIKKKIENFVEQTKRTSIQINRIPEKYKTRFMQIAKQEFCEDYGMCLRELIKIYDGFYPNGHEEIEAKIDLMAQEIGMIQKKLQKEEEEKPTFEVDKKKNRIKMR